MSLLALATATTTADDEDHDSPNENYDDDKDDSQTEDYANLQHPSSRHVVCKLCRGTLVKMDTWDGDCDHTAYSYAIRMYQRTLTLRGTIK